MTTYHDEVRSRIGQVSDGATFENIVRFILPSIDPQFRWLTPTGVGAHGKTVKDPADAVGIVWSADGPIGIGFASTTQQTAIEPKLLEDYQKLIARVVRNDAPQTGPRAIVALASNLHLNSTQTSNLIKRGVSDRVQVHVLNAVGIADLLSRPENQGIAEIFLGIRPWFSNWDSLRLASKRGIDLLESRLLGNPSLMPRGGAVDEILSSLHLPLIELIGPSGGTKTTTAAQAARAVLDADGLAIHIPENLVDRHDSLVGAIDAAIRDAGYAFHDSPGNFIMGGKDGKHVLIIVDDIQRLAAPSTAFERVQSWSRQIKREDERDSGPQITVLCTRWPRGRLNDAESMVKNPGAIMVTAPDLQGLIQYLSDQFQHVRNPMTRAEVRSIIEALGTDPLLIGLFLESHDAARPRSQSDTWRQFIQRGLERTKDQRGATFTEVQQCWDWLGDLHLRNGAVTHDLGHLRTLARQLGHEPALLALVETSMLISNVGGTVQFRHDRLRNWLLGSRIAAHHSKGTLNESWPAWDPFFNQAIADAIVESGFDARLISDVAQHRPEALAGTLRSGTTDLQVLSHLKDWARKSSKAWHIEPGGDYATDAIAGVYRESLGELLELLPVSFSTLEARMATGDVDAAILLFQRWPVAGSPQPEAALEVALQQHRPEFLGGLRRRLERATEDEVLSAGITLAITARLQELADLVDAQSRGRSALLGEAIAFYYIVRPLGFEEKGRELIHQWLKARAQPAADQHDGVLEELRHAFAAAPIGPESVESFLCAMLDVGAGWEGAWVMHDVRADYGARATVRLFANHCRQMSTSELDHAIFSVDSSLFSRYHKTFRHQNPSAEERGALLALALSDTDETVRYVAARVWLMDPSRQDLKQIKEMASGTVSWHAMHARAMIGDVTVIPWIQAEAEKWSHMIELLKHVWSSSAKKAFEKWLDARILEGIPKDAKGDPWWSANRLLMSIPSADATSILSHRLDRLPVVPDLVQAALCLDGALPTWAMEHISAGPSPSPFLRHMFALHGSTSEGGTLLPIRAAQVRSWEPIFTYFDQRELADLYKICRRDGDEAWIRSRLQHKLRVLDRKWLCPTVEEIDADIQSDLQMSNSTGVGMVYRWRRVSVSRTELLSALSRVSSKMDLELIAFKLEFPLISWCDRESLAHFWQARGPGGPNASIVRRRTEYLVASKNPPHEFGSPRGV